MFLYWDPIQTAKMIYILRTQANSLAEENVELKNRPAPEAKPAIIVQFTKQKHRIDLEKDVKDWNSAYFVKYFQFKYNEKYETRPHFRSDEWGAHALRIHDFLHRHDKEITKEEYKQFIDYLFKKVFSKTFKPIVGNILSDRYFYKWYDIHKKKTTSQTITEDDGIRKFTVQDIDDMLDGIGV